ncbi:MULTISPECIES: hypothetical protein [unclassified Photobacterium]|uniref:hypothetical protein n=1 Tax=unclassified Photobacterium TaxID=2628852 RepID=UPI001B8B6E9C|nr:MULTISPECIES: hypothetical protein [unclassified Photobacterium]MDO6705938.1 hypothetical protein [Photobacterium sp. 1_MG-2023]QUJ69270.1 hypothetical protein KDD30_21080 [Photobacterium sp. GJ3]
MELRNRSGDIAHMADNLTLKEIVDMGFSIDLCDENYDPNEHWTIRQPRQRKEGEYPSDS